MRPASTGGNVGMGDGGAGRRAAHVVTKQADDRTAPTRARRAMPIAAQKSSAIATNTRGALVALAGLTLAATLGVCSSDAVAATSVPADLQAAIGKVIWYAPHAGCLDRLKTRDAGSGKERWVRRFPENEQKLRITEAVMAEGQWMYRFEWAGEGGGTGQTPAQKVVTDVRFEALPTTFYQTCFFLEPPQAVAGFLRAQQPLAFQRYDDMSRTEREAEIAKIQAADKKPAR